VCVAGVGAGCSQLATLIRSSPSRASPSFVFALVCHTLGDDQARRKLGVNSTGLPFNSVIAVELNADRTMNPLVNAGAIAATSLVPGTTAEEKFQSILAAMSRFAGRRLVMDGHTGRPIQARPVADARYPGTGASIGPRADEGSEATNDVQPVLFDQQVDSLPHRIPGKAGLLDERHLGRNPATRWVRSVVDPPSYEVGELLGRMYPEGLDHGDQVPRLLAFQAAHPEITIKRPTQNPFPAWVAEQDGRMLVSRITLKYFMDELEQMFP
jgi:hypothetical protein